MVSQSLFHFTNFLLLSACLFESTAVFAGTTSKPPSLKSMEETKPSTVRKQALKADAIPPLTQLCRRTVQTEMQVEDEGKSGFYNSVNVISHFLYFGSGVLNEPEHLKLFQEALSIVIHHLFPKDFSEENLQHLKSEDVHRMFAKLKSDGHFVQSMTDQFKGWGFTQLKALWRKLGNNEEVRTLMKRSLENRIIEVNDFKDLTENQFISRVRLKIQTDSCKDLETFLHSCPNIKSIAISGAVSKNHLEAISRISTPFSLDLMCSDVCDVSALRQAQNLHTLDLNFTNVSDVSALGQLTNLRIVILRNTKVSDVSPLGQLSNLESLDIGHTDVRDVSALKQATKLRFLDITNTYVKDVSAVSHVAKLIGRK